jgi:glycosyltransferase involved in cell wall biosynthesis
MVRILYVNLQGRIGGAENSLLLLVRHLPSQFVASVACPARTQLTRMLASIQIDSYELPEPPGRLYFSISALVYWLRMSMRLIEITFRAKPDVIHANSFYAGVPALLTAIVTRKKLLLHARDLANFGFISRFYGRFSQKIIAVSHAVKDDLIGKGIQPDKIEVIYNGVDKDSFSQSGEAKDSLSTPGYPGKDYFVFAHIGQFVPWKNHILYLKAASNVAKHLRDARFALVGANIFNRGTKYERSVFSYAKSSPVAERFDFVGWQENMNEVWPQIDCLVHTAEQEPFGRVIIEAMAHRIPVIAVGTCGPGEIIQDNKTGILVPADNVEALSEAMLNVAQDRQLTDRLVNAAFEHTMSNFTADKTAAQIQEVYMELLAA